MENTSDRAIAIVGVGAILPDAPNVTSFWENIKSGRYSVTEVRPDRWDPNLYYDPDPHAPDKTYSKIGGWVRDYTWDPMKWRLPIPPRVADAMDGSQKWAIACTRQALEDFGYPKRLLDPDRTAVILGNAMGGERHYFTVLRAYFPEYARELTSSASFAALPPATRDKIVDELHERMGKHLPEITEDSMPGELANCIAGRIANVFNFHGPNFVCDAACASAMAAISAAAEGLIHNDYDVAVTGGIDRNMGASTFVKFCKIGALSATGTRPYAEGADGFVMGEGAAVFLMKRLADAERDGDKIYAVLRGMGGSSDGRGKGITAPNPAGQKFAIERAWKNAGLSPATATYIEGHGTSTRVGDVVEVQSMVDVLGGFHLASHSVALGSVKSNFGHLKGAAGAAGLLKLTLALRDKVLPPSVHCEHPNPDIDFAHSPLYVNTELRPWDVPADSVRRAGLSAFGFGGTNFHAVLEEYIPHRLNGNGKRTIAVTESSPATETTMTAATTSPVHISRSSYKAPLRGALVIGATSDALLTERLRLIEKEAKQGRAPAPAAPAEADLLAPERIAIDYANAEELATKSASALKALSANQPAMWKALRAQGIFRGHGPKPKVAFLYPGQGSQYVNMLKPLLDSEPIVAETFREADAVMTPILGRPLSEFVFVNRADPAAVAESEEALRQTAITQPAVLATDLALTRLLAAYAIEPDFTMGHSLGEYGALIAAGGLPFADALEAVAARGREMTRYSPADKGRMAAVFAPLEEIERILKTVNGYVVIANINSEHQSVIGGASPAVEQAMAALISAGYEVTPLPVSHAFHTSIVAPASEPLRQVLERLHLQSPNLPIVANVNGEFYPAGPNVVPQMLDILAKQVAAPVQFIKGLRTLYAAGARMFVEVGPKKALHGFTEDVLGANGDVISIFTNHPKTGDIAAFNQALCCLYAAGFGLPAPQARQESTQRGIERAPGSRPRDVQPIAAPMPPTNALLPRSFPRNGDRLKELGLLFAEVLERGWEICHGQNPAPSAAPVVITGAALGLPGTDHIFDDGNIARILRGEQFINAIPMRFRQLMLDKHITRLVKSDNGGPTFETIVNIADVIKLAGRAGEFNLESEFGVPGERVAALDRVTQLAIAAGIDALRDAGIPLVLRYKTTSKGTLLPDRWALPDSLRDDTGVIFASAFPGLDSFSDEMRRYYEYHALLDQLAALESLHAHANRIGDSGLMLELDKRIDSLRTTIDKEPYVFDRRFLLRTLSMGHSQFAEFIGARGPNTQVNAACASTTQAVALAEDWIHAGRCSRVIVISSDDVTSDHLMEWMGAGFLASGAAATDEVVTDAAVPFDRRRHGLIVGMGAAALVVESASAAKQRGIQPICEVISTVTNNSAFHGTRLDVQHIGQVMETLIANAEARTGATRQEIAAQTVFVSHETYTPARGGSASAEIHALRKVFGDVADRIVIANTKGLTGHAMGTGIEDVVAVKALETGLVPPVANFREVDPELGSLNLSKGGAYPVEYALHLGAGFGSQISMMLLRWVKTADGVRRDPRSLGYDYRIADPSAWSAWLSSVTGHPNSTLEVIRRTLRIRDQQQATKVAEHSDVRRSAATEVVAALASGPAPAPKLKTEAPATVVKPEPAAKIPAAIPVAPPLTGAPKTTSDVKDKVLALVSEKTGYPVDMLDLDLDLEADLGVDTVKQAEVFATIREAYNIPRDENRKLRDYPTLAHVIRFVYENRPDLTVTSKAAQTTTGRPPEVEPSQPQLASTPVPATLSVPAATGDPVKERVLALVVEKTGYPQDMLDLDLDLEADLGVDTVKQAEMFAAIREIYNIPRDENRKLRDYPTLAHVIRFVYENRPDLTTSAPATSKTTVEVAPPKAQATLTPTTVPSPALANAEDPVKERVLALVVEKTGYPQDMLDLELDLEADLGVDTVKQAEMFAAIREIYNIPRDENRKLRDYPTLAHVIRFVYENRPDLATAPTAASKTVVAAPQPVATKEEKAPVPATQEIRVNQNASESVQERVLSLVVEKTGYPKEMLDLDLDLEADLGVDTVKQAEMLAAIREIYNIPRDENRKLRDYPTLAHVIRFVFEKRPDLAVPVAPATIVEIPSPVPVVSTVATAPVESDSADSIRQKVLDIVAQKTGYPTDMLDPELDLEADLGIDTVKQAEMFAAIRAAYNIPRDENLKLRDFPTLAHVIRFAQERAHPKNVPENISAEQNPAAPATSPAPSPKPKQSRPAPASLDAANRIPRRVPIPVLRPPISECKPSGVKLERGQRVVIMPDKGGVADTLTQLLETKGVEVLRIPETPNVDALIDCVKKWKSSGPITGVYWLPALDQEPDLRKMEPSTWREAVRLRLKSLFATMRTLYDDIAKPGAFLTCATRMGGQHGYDDAGALAPLGGAVTGFSKTYKRERPESFVKAVDFSLDAKAPEVAQLLIDETLRDPGAIEIGYKGDLRWAIGLEEQPAVDGQPGLELDENTVFVVTGAAGSIVSAITADLATASGGTFYLLDLVPEPDPNNPDLKRFATDKDGLKRDLFTRIQARGERATPALVEKELAALERAQAALNAIDAVRAAGGTPYYYSVNLADTDGVAKVMEVVRQRSGHIDVLLHAAGLERSRPLADKDPREFDLVFNVKADGFFNLIHGVGDMPLGATVAFSSIAGRFGNPGQTDYSSANDLLCKITSSFRTTRPKTRGIAIDWTAWGGIGMATRGSIPKVMEQAGIDMLPPEAGVPLIRRELTMGGTRGEIVIGQRLGVLLKEWGETGGLDLSASEGNNQTPTASGPMIGKIARAGLYNGLIFETTLDPKTQPFLHDHQISGTPVLPGVMGVEAFAEAALKLLPGWHIKAVEGVDFLAPFKFYRNEPRVVTVETTIHPDGNEMLANCRLIGRRSLPSHSEPQVTTHFTGRVRLTRHAVDLTPGSLPGSSTGLSIDATDIYRAYFHGPAYQVLEKAWWDGNRMIGLFAKDLPSNHVPPELTTPISPRWIELCFQTAGLWEMGMQERMGLPNHIDSVSVRLGSVAANGRLYAIVTPDPVHGSFDANVVDAQGNRFVHMSGYRTIATPISVNAEQVKVLRALLSPSPVAA